MIMRKIDDLVANQIEVLKGQAFYQDFLDQYSTFDEWKQDLTKYIMMGVALLLPLFITFVFYLIYAFKAADLATEESIIYTSNQIIAKKTALSRGNSAVGMSPISNTAVLEAKIPLLGISPEKIRIASGSFNFIENDGVTTTNATFEFQELSSDELFTLLKSTTQKLRMKLREIQINKNPDNNLLEGSFGVSHFSKMRAE
jgi:hypothetical protein